jgi:AcrR family transcriptional regulator
MERALADTTDLAGFTYAARRVLVGAAALFHERGAPATSVRDIARACDLSPGALYKHFDSKDDVLFVLVQHGHDSLERRVTAALQGAAPDPMSRISAFVHAYVMGHLVHPELAQVVRREYVHLSPDRVEVVVRRRRAMRAQLTSLLRAGAKDGEFELIGGRNGPTRTAVMVLDMCSRTSDWYDPTRARAERPETLAERYVLGALRLVGARAA